VVGCLDVTQCQMRCLPVFPISLESLVNASVHLILRFAGIGMGFFPCHIF